MDEEILIAAGRRFVTPFYVFDTDVFEHRVETVRRVFGEKTRLCYSVKANPFLLKALPDIFSFLEVCSPGELCICENLSISHDKIIFSGVSKTREEIERAYDDGVAIFTAESRLQVQFINECAMAYDGQAKLILRISHGSQFGMDIEEIRDIISHRNEYNGLEIIGVHYFTGTQKNKSQTIIKELEFLDRFCRELEVEYGFIVSHVEYGAGLAVEYYKDYTEKTDMELLEEVGMAIRSFSEKYPLTVEMGRFFAAECGFYLTRVMDIKRNSGTNYVICDGGINQLNYFGQNMAMKVPPVFVPGKFGGNEEYCLCGSLCTTADVLVRKVALPKLDIGDLICFLRCGAYSVSEGIAMFLSRAIPGVVLYNEKDGMSLSRALTEIYFYNTP